MSVQCSICLHPQRKEINKALVAGGTCRALASRFGVSKSALDRHGMHIAKELAAAKRKRAFSGLRVSTWVVKKLLKAAKACEVHPGQFIVAADALNRALLTFGRFNGEIKSDRVQALFVNLGVSNENELQRAVQVARSGQHATLEGFRDELLDSVRFLLRERPEWRSDFVRAIDSESGAVVLDGEGNGVAHGTIP